MKKPRRKSALIKAVILLLFAAGIFAAFAVSRYPLKYAGIIRANAEKYGLDAALVCAVIHTESKFRENALSPKGAGGLMQLTAPTADWLAERMSLNDYSFADIFDPALNIRIGAFYISWLLERYDGDERLALAAYNAGIGNVDKWLRNESYSADGKRLDTIPFRETRDFVSRVAQSRKIYEILLKLYK